MNLVVRASRWGVCAALVIVASSVVAQSNFPGQSAVETTNQLTMPQWVHPATPGKLPGKLILPAADGSFDVVPNAVLLLTDADGQSIKTKSDENGAFSFSDVLPGVYALTARARNAFACCAMHVVPDHMAAADQFPESVEISAAAIDFVTIKSSIIRYLPPVLNDTRFEIAGADLAALSSRVVGGRSFRVLQTEGGLKGRIHMAGATGSSLNDAQLVNVFLIHEGETVDRVVSNHLGIFEFENVSPGEYSILALGQAGMGMAGFELVDASILPESIPLGSNGKTLTAQVQVPDASGEFSMQVAPLPQAAEGWQVIIRPENEPEEVVDEPIYDEVLPEVVYDQFGNPIDAFGNPIGQYGTPVDQFGNPIDGGFSGGGGTSGGGGGGYGGGGGGFGGGGGLGGLASLAGLGALAGLNDNDNGGGGNALFPLPEASPATPSN
ncbi:MAG: carboxypeptidase-like regulatory domain-containing protein [Planctomycetota bacterium]